MEKDKDIIEIIVDEKPSDKRRVNLSALKKLFSQLNIPPLYIKLYAASLSVLIFAAFTTGILVPKSINVIDRRLNSLHSSDKTYLEKQTAYDEAQNEEKRLQTSHDQKKAELEKLNNAQNNLDKLSQKNSELENEKNELQDEVNLKQKTLNALDISLNSQIRSSVTLSSGRYTVGENISEGKYTIMGTGSIVISTSGTARVNKALKSDGESFTLKNGDIIKIDGSAKLTLE